MKKLFLILVLSFFVNICFGYQEYVEKQIDGKIVRYIKVIIDEDNAIITSVSQNGDTLKDLVDKVGGVSGITGGYFCPADYPECNGKTFSRINRFYKGISYNYYGYDLGYNGMFGFDRNGKFTFILNNSGRSDGINRQLNHEKLKDMYYGIANFPVLIVDGENVIKESKDVLDLKQRTRGTKGFICVEKNEKVFKMGHIFGVNIEEMADFLQKNLQCNYAITLDTGKSTGLIYNNKNIVKPGRKIMDAFVVVGKKGAPIIENRFLFTSKSEAFTQTAIKIDKLIEEDFTQIIVLLERLEEMKGKVEKDSGNYKLYTELQEYIVENY